MSVATIDRAILRLVGGRLRVGGLTVDLPDGSTRVYRGRSEGPRARVEVHDTRLFRRLAATGAIGLADAYVAGDFDADDLASLLELGALHLEPHHAPRLPAAVTRFGKAAWRAIGRADRTRGPLRDIVEHYDLGNAFYAQWLDPTMTYSSAVFVDPGMSLHDAQREKYRRLGAAMDVREGDRVLEIGSGWGGMAVYLAGALGADVTTVTVSKEQARYVEKLAAEHGVADRVAVRLEDFSRTPGTYDHIVSIEMIESIPRTRWAPYFATLRDRLAPGGSIGLQVITVADHHWESSDANPDFIRRYVFPGGQVPSPRVLRQLADAHGLAWRSNEEHGRSYARTLAAWRAAFDARWPQIAEIGFDERFRRMWRYYLSYCEGGFRAARVDVSQIVLGHAGTA
jgi:cyclopropane-fatty-acyl-phospholipid synthase